MSNKQNDIILENQKENLEEEIRNIWLHFDSIINAHLWGDYSFNGRRMWSEANKYINKLKEKYPN